MKRFENLINELPYSDQVARSKRTTWEKLSYRKCGFAKKFVEVFGDKDEIELSRSDLFHSSRKDKLDEYIVKVIIWGYPRGPRGDNFSNICSNIDSLKNLLKSVKKKCIRNWENHIEKLSDIDGVGLSTYTKILYFRKIKIQGKRALILDDRVISALRNKYFPELKEIDHIGIHNASKYYPNYLNCIHKISRKHNHVPDKIELFLFLFGGSLKLSTYSGDDSDCHHG